MADMIRMHGRKIFALILIIALIMPENLSLSFAAQTYETGIDSWQVDCYWSDVSCDYVWDSRKDEYRRPTLIFTYRLESAGRDYPAGSIRVEIPGIGQAGRTAVKPAASLPTDSEGSEWEAVWDQERDIYTFTNIFEVGRGESVNGGFEIIWDLRSRDLVDGYEQRRSPSFGVSGEVSLSLKPLGFSFSSARDRYKIKAESSILASSGAHLDDDHVWYGINTTFNKTWLARGLNLSTCTVRVEIPDDMSADDIVLLNSSGIEMVVTEKSDGELESFLFQDRRGDLGGESYTFSQKFMIGFDKGKADSQKITVREHLDRLYLDESEWVREGLEGEGVDVRLDFTLQSCDFAPQGLIYSHDLWNEEYENYNKPPDYYWYGYGDEDSHLEPPEYYERFPATGLYNGTVVEFNLRGSAAKDRGPAYLSMSASPSDMAFYDASPSDMEYIIINDTDAGNANFAPASPSVLRAGAGSGYSMVLGDDELAIVLQDGSIRPLKGEEYDIAYLSVPSHEPACEYEIYGAASADLPFEAYKLLETSDMSATRSFSLPAGIKAVYVKINDITGTFETRIRLGVRLNLDWTKEQDKPPGERCDHENRLIDFSYLRILYRDAQNVEHNDCAMSAGDYGGSYGEELSRRDMDIYGEMLLRDYSNVWLRNTAMTLKAGISLASFESNLKDAYLSRVVANGTIKADDPGELTSFSLYTVLPDGLRFDFYLEPVVVTGLLTASDGSVIDDPSGYVSFSEGFYNGKKMLQADFDFGSRPLAAEADNWVRIHFPVSLSFIDAALGRDSFTVNAYLMVHDKETERIIGPAITDDEYDIDKNGITTEKMAYASAKRSIRENADEWREFAFKSVKSAYSDGYVAQTVARRSLSAAAGDEDAGSLYEYRLSFGLGSSSAKDIIFFDHLEMGGQDTYGSGKDEDVPRSGWHGEFCSVDTEYAKDQGLRPTVYYSVNADEPFDLSSGGWSSRLPQDPSKVRSIAVRLDTSYLSSGLMRAADATCVTVKMKAPADESLTGKQAVNRFCVSYSSYGANGSYENEVSLFSAPATVTLLDSVGKIILQKVDADNLIYTDADGKNHYAALTGAEFMIYDGKRQPIYDSPKSLDFLGRLVIENVTPGQYYWEEVKAPEGYERIAGRHPFTIDGTNGMITVEDHRIPATVTLTKHDLDHPYSAGLAGAVFELFTGSGDKVFTDDKYVYDEKGKNGTFTTGEDGSFTITHLPWGSYVFEEVRAPAGYQLPQEKICFTADALSVQNTIELSVMNERGWAELIIDKEVNDVCEAFGDPFFIFRITRSDGVVYHASINLTPQVLSGSVRLNVEQGYTYRVEEVGVSRYLPDRVEGIKNAVADKFFATADLTGNKEAEIKFYNRMEQYEKFSHTAGIVNSVRGCDQGRAFSEMNRLS